MKKIKSIIAICTVAVMIAACDKETNPCLEVCQNGGTLTENCSCDCPTGYTGQNCETPVPGNPNPPCNITCQNGGTVTASCKCDCPSGYTGTYCQIFNVPINNSVSYMLCPIRYAGDNEYGGHIKIDGSVQLTLGSNNTKVYAVVNATYIESAGGMDTKARINGQINTNNILLYTAPSGKKVSSINSSSFTSFYWYPQPNYHGIKNLYPGNFVYRIEMVGDTSGDDLPCDGTTQNSRFRIWFDDFKITLTNQ